MAAYERLAVQVKKGLVLLVDQPWIPGSVKKHLRTSLALAPLGQEKPIWTFIGLIVYKSAKKLAEKDVAFFKSQRFNDALLKLLSDEGLMDEDAKEAIREMTSFFSSDECSRLAPVEVAEELMKIANNISAAYYDMIK